MTQEFHIKKAANGWIVITWETIEKGTNYEASGIQSEHIAQDIGKACQILLELSGENRSFGNCEHGIELCGICPRALIPINCPCDKWEPRKDAP